MWPGLHCSASRVHMLEKPVAAHGDAAHPTCCVHTCWPSACARCWARCCPLGSPLPLNAAAHSCTDVLVNCFRSALALSPTSEVVQTAYLAVGKIAPDYEGAELNVSASSD